MADELLAHCRPDYPKGTTVGDLMDLARSQAGCLDQLNTQLQAIKDHQPKAKL